MIELFSHLIILSILVYGYNLRQSRTKPSETYAAIAFSLPPSFFDTSKPITSSTTLNDLADYINGEKALKFVSKTLSRPVPVIPFDYYVRLAQHITRSVSSSYANLATESDVGRPYTNLLLFGSLHFAPYPSPLVDSYIAYMQSNTETFSSVPYYTHSSEDAAVDAILSDPNQPTFALIVFRNVTPTRINYVIRQNFNTLPSTAQLMSKFTLGLQTLFQDYYLSGFMTVQDTVDLWAADYINATTSGHSPACSSLPQPLSMPFPTYAYSVNEFFDTMGSLLGIFYTSKSFYPLLHVISYIDRQCPRCFPSRDW
jgi:hypothetical protein